MSDFSQQLASQSWALYGVGMFFILLGTFARWRRVRNVAQFAVDDWLMMTAIPIFYTGLIVCLNVIATGGGSNLFPPEQFDAFTQEEMNERIKGSKIVIVSDQFMLNVIWTLKASMLFMFARILTGTTNLKWIKAVALWVVIGWFAVQIAFFTACRPFVGYWAVPPPNPQCTTLEHFAIVQAAFNLSSNILIIAIPIPMIASLSLPLKQKVGLGILFSMGTFVIVAAILTKVYNLSNIYATTYMLWYTHEASVAVYVANLPGIWPLLCEHIRFFREHTNSHTSGQSKMPRYGSQQYGNISSTKGPRSRVRTLTNFDSDDVELGTPYANLGAQSIHISEKPGAGSDNPSVNGVVVRDGSQDSYERATGLESMTSWKSMSVMGVQINTKVEIQNDRWIGTQLEPGQSRVVKIEGPMAQAGRR